MKAIIRRNLVTLATALCALAFGAAAQAQDPYVELQVQQPVDDPGKIEVIEFFWYGCIHCYNLEPLLENWIRRQAPDVRFRRVPAVFNPRWARDAGIFYAFEALGVGEKLHRPLFDAIHRDRLNTEPGAAFDQWLTKQGLEPKKVEETIKSFSVVGRVRRAERMSKDYRVEGTPALAVQGRYTVASGATMLTVTDQLVSIVRGTLGAKK